MVANVRRQHVGNFDKPSYLTMPVGLNFVRWDRGTACLFPTLVPWESVALDAVPQQYQTQLVVDARLGINGTPSMGRPRHRTFVHCAILANEGHSGEWKLDVIIVSLECAIVGCSC